MLGYYILLILCGGIANNFLVISRYDGTVLSSTISDLGFRWVFLWCPKYIWGVLGSAGECWGVLGSVGECCIVRKSTTAEIFFMVIKALFKISCSCSQLNFVLFNISWSHNFCIKYFWSYIYHSVGICSWFYRYMVHP